MIMKQGTFTFALGRETCSLHWPLSRLFMDVKLILRFVVKHVCAMEFNCVEIDYR